MSVRAILAGLLALVLSGCATLSPPPPLPAEGLPAGAKVGVVVQVESGGTHTHVGTTVFNNFANEVPLPFDLAAQLRDALGKNLSARGAQVVALDPSALPAAGSGRLVMAQDGAWVVNPEQAAAVKALRETHGLAALVVVDGRRTMVSQECSNMGCTERWIDKSGLFTRSFLGLTRAFAVAALGVSVVRLDTPADLTRHEPMLSVIERKVRPLSGFVEPKEFKAITADEFKPVAEAIRGYVDELGKTTAEALTRR